MNKQLLRQALAAPKKSNPRPPEGIDDPNPEMGWTLHFDAIYALEKAIKEA